MRRSRCECSTGRMACSHLASFWGDENHHFFMGIPIDIGDRLAGSLSLPHQLLKMFGIWTCKNDSGASAISCWVTWLFRCHQWKKSMPKVWLKDAETDEPRLFLYPLPLLGLCSFHRGIFRSGAIGESTEHRAQSPRGGDALAHYSHRLGWPGKLTGLGALCGSVADDKIGPWGFLG